MSDAIARKSRLAVPVGGGDGMSAGIGLAASSSSAYGGIKSHNSSSTLPTPLSPGLNTTRALLSSHYNSTNSHNSILSSSSTSSTTTMNPIQYMNRLIDVTQMDIQSGLDQMKTLISNRPQAVYKTAYYRKQTKNHWARDDPAFIALQIIFLLVASIAYCIAFRISIVSSISFILCSIIWHFIGSGILIATICRDIANRYLNNVSSSANGNVTSNTSSSLYVRQHVEWMYSFDIHCNSFFPVFVVLCTYYIFCNP
jgi:UNC-50 family